MVKTNYFKLQREYEILNFKLDNCISKCSKTSSGTQDFLDCTEGDKGCFVKYKASVTKLYNNMYKIILEKHK